MKGKRFREEQIIAILNEAAEARIANGGLMFQFLILFPLWGSILAVAAKRRLVSTI
ncbi:MAG: hypothetical protein ABSG53_11555 [Thermoguttaceae bacterium]|jgi:hypothetical protein